MKCELCGKFERDLLFRKVKCNCESRWEKPNEEEHVINPATVEKWENEIVACARRLLNLLSTDLYDKHAKHYLSGLKSQTYMVDTGMLIHHILQGQDAREILKRLE